MLLLIGVDAGASHTEAIAGPEPGRILARARGQPGAVRSGRAGEAAAAITTTITDALTRAVAHGGQPAAIVVGAAGAGRESERRELEQALRARWGSVPAIHVTTDGEIALEAAFPEGCGIVLTAGSGSIAFARDRAGHLQRAGGLGWRIGDEGSGYDLAREALGAVGRAADGRERSTALTARVLAVTGSRSVDDLARWAAAATPREIAALAELVCEIARAGDPVAQDLVALVVERLAGHVAALLPHLAGEGSARLAFNGGLLSPGSLVRAGLEALVAQRHPTAIVEPGLVDPALGALRIAARLAR